MARVNVGVDPKLLSDQHLVAESVEITMITGALRKDGYVIKGRVPDKFPMGTGHINFFKNKLVYLKRRLDIVNEEMIRRTFKPGTKIDLDEFPEILHGDWTPSLQDSMILRVRVADRLITRANGKSASRLHRYNKRYLGWYNKCLGNKIVESDLFHV
jgi:deoxyribonuclease (pyrimidine dimer)